MVVSSLDPAAEAVDVDDGDVRTYRRIVHCNDGSRQPDDVADLEDLLQHATVLINEQKKA